MSRAKLKRAKVKPAYRRKRRVRQAESGPNLLLTTLAVAPGGGNRRRRVLIGT